MDYASGHKWDTGFLGALLIQLGEFQNHLVPSGKWSCHQFRVSSEAGQRRSFLLLYFPLVCGPFIIIIIIFARNVIKGSENSCTASLSFGSQIFKGNFLFYLLGLNYFPKGRTVVKFLVVISPTQILLCSRSIYKKNFSDINHWLMCSYARRSCL